MVKKDAATDRGNNNVRSRARTVHPGWRQAGRRHPPLQGRWQAAIPEPAPAPPARNPASEGPDLPTFCRRGLEALPAKVLTQQSADCEQTTTPSCSRRNNARDVTRQRSRPPRRSRKRGRGHSGFVFKSDSDCRTDSLPAALTREHSSKSSSWDAPGCGVQRMAPHERLRTRRRLLTSPKPHRPSPANGGSPEARDRGT